MNRTDLVKEVSEFILTEVNKEDPDGELDLGAVAGEVEEFIQELDASDDDEDETDDTEATK
jgi:hypothetical protein